MCRGRDWVKNGDAWRVLAVHDDGALTVSTAATAAGSPCRPTMSPRMCSWTMPAPSAAPKALTVDRAHLLVDPGWPAKTCTSGCQPGPARHPAVCGDR